VTAEHTAAISNLANVQHGAFATGQLDDLGVTSRWVENLARRGVIRRVARGVYVVSGSATTWHRHLQIGLLALGEQSWVSHRAAAKLLGLDRTKDTEPVEFTTPRSSRNRACPYPVHSTIAMPPLDHLTIDGLRCTSGTRTVLDLAHARVPVTQLEAAIDSAVRLGWSAPLAITTRLAELRGPGRYGSRLLDRLLIDSGGHSMLERRFLELVRRAGLPRPRTQVIYQQGGTTVARVDFLFDPYDVVIETDGRRGHSSPGERAREAQRRGELQDLGTRVYQYTWEDVTTRGSYVARTLTERLHAAGWRR
jgi:hypothetical protein